MAAPNDSTSRKYSHRPPDQHNVRPGERGGAPAPSPFLPSAQAHPRYSADGPEPARHRAEVGTAHRREVRADLHVPDGAVAP